jgi:glycosyltransferase involved in cell wall biosynthesis
VGNFKILEVVSGFGLGGAEKALIARMKYLPPKFQQLVLNVRPEIDGFKPIIEFNEYRIESSGFRRLIEIHKFLSSSVFDVVIVRTPLDAIRFGFLKSIQRDRKFKLVFEAHSNFLTKRRGLALIIGALLHWNARKIDLVISVSDDVSNGPLCDGQRNVERIYLGSDLEFVDSNAATNAWPHLLFVGRLVDLKRPIWLLERIRNLAEEISLPEPTLTMVGSGPLESAAREFIYANNLTSIVRFVGGQSDVSPYFMAATHLVSCSTNEGLPLTFFEAKLAGLIIVATPSGGGSEIFDEEDLELGSFEGREFELALLDILKSAPPSPELRHAIQEKSKWMSAREGAIRYYALISRLLSN